MKHRELAYCGVLGAAALLLPMMFHLVHLGHIFMPMATGMPPFYPPIAPVMAVELVVISLIIGAFRFFLPRVHVLVILIPALVFGRVINAGLMYLVAGFMKLPAAFVAGISFLSGWPGVVLMLVVIPAVVKLSKDHLNISPVESKNEK